MDSIDDASSADTGAAFGQDDSEFNVFNTDRQLSALQTAARMLGGVTEKKSLIYFASGLRLNGVNNQAQLHATVDAAIRAGVSFWPIDARGLVASDRLAIKVCTPVQRPKQTCQTFNSRRTRCFRSLETPVAKLCSTTTISPVA
jgi:hypothetical protein